MLGLEGIQDAAHSSQGKLQGKGGQPKQKSGKRHGCVRLKPHTFC